MSGHATSGRIEQAPAIALTPRGRFGNQWVGCHITQENGNEKLQRLFA